MTDNTKARPALLRPALTIVTAIVLLVFLGSSMLQLFGRQMLYPRPPWRVPSPPPAPLEEVVLELDSGTRIMAWGRPGIPAGEDLSRPAMIFFHGNGENLETLRLSGFFHEAAAFAGYVLAVDYPGYGRSDGSPSESSLVAAGRAGLAWLDERHERRAKIVVGWSLGAAVAIQVAAAAADGTVDRLALLSPWDDLRSLAAVHFPAWLARLAVADPYDSRSVAKSIEVPTLIIHGARDRIIPIVHGERLIEAFGPHVARFVRVEEAGHNDLMARPEVWSELGAFCAVRSGTPANP